MIRLALALGAFVLAAPTAAASPLDTAQQLSRTKFAGWTYGPFSEAAKTSDGLSFVAALIRETMGRPLTGEEQAALIPGRRSSQDETLAWDPETWANTLTARMGVAISLGLGDVHAGDLICYALPATAGQVGGEAAVIVARESDTLTLFSPNPGSDGMGEHRLDLTPFQKGAKLQCVRLHPELGQQRMASQDGRLWFPRPLSQPLADGGLSWTWKAPRWGMYRLQFHFTDDTQDEQAPFRLTMESSEKEGQRISPISPSTPLQVYLPETRTYTLAYLGHRHEQLEAVSLIPAPEGASPSKEADQRVVLNSRDATVKGRVLRYEPNPKKLCLGFWSHPEDRAEWTFTVASPGVFEVEIDQGCGRGHGGSLAYVSCSEQDFPFTVEDTGHFQNFRTRSLGQLHLSEVGPHTLTVGARNKAKGAVMDVREVRLLRIVD